MARDYARNYPCVNCRKPKTAARPGWRCPSCSRDNRNAWDRDRRAKAIADGKGMTTAQRSARYRENQRKQLEAAARAHARRPLSPDTDIALYRAEKAKRAHRETQDIQDAKRLLSLYGGDPLQAKRGRPKKGQEQAA